MDGVQFYLHTWELLNSGDDAQFIDRHAQWMQHTLRMQLENPKKAERLKERLATPRFVKTVVVHEQSLILFYETQPGEYRSSMPVFDKLVLSKDGRHYISSMHGPLTALLNSNDFGADFAASCLRTERQTME